jgi:hypothetical protein
VAVETDPLTGLARYAAPLRLGGVLAQALPDFPRADRAEIFHLPPHRI